jgi:hypothetical protein
MNARRLQGFMSRWNKEQIPRCARDDRLKNWIQNLELIDEEEIGGGPQRGGDGMLGTVGNDDFENFAISGKNIEKLSADGRIVRFKSGEFAQRFIDNFGGRGHLRCETVGAELHDRINFIEVPGNAGGHGYGALEPFGVFSLSELA